MTDQDKWLLDDVLHHGPTTTVDLAAIRRWAAFRKRDEELIAIAQIETAMLTSTHPGKLRPADWLATRNALRTRQLALNELTLQGFLEHVGHADDPYANAEYVIVVPELDGLPDDTLIA